MFQSPKTVHYWLKVDAARDRRAERGRGHAGPDRLKRGSDLRCSGWCPLAST
jgi:hypothetical protein